MSTILVNWLNNDVGLSQPISLDSLDKDFANGYLLGELLYKHQWQTNWRESFVSDETNRALIKNFCALEPVLSSLEIPFNINICLDVIAGKKETIIQLLYSIKMALERIELTGKTTSTFFTPGMKKLPNLPHRVSKPKYDKGKSHLFEKHLKEIIGSDKKRIEEIVLKRFTDEERRQKNLCAQGNDDELEEYKQGIANRRQMNIDKQLANNEFMKTWNEVNVMTWLENQELKRRREKHFEKVERFLHRKKVSAYEKQVEEEKNYIAQDLDTFEKVKQSKLEKIEADLNDESMNNLDTMLSNIASKAEHLKALSEERASRRSRFILEEEDYNASGVRNEKVNDYLNRSANVDEKLFHETDADKVANIINLMKENSMAEGEKLKDAAVKKNDNWLSLQQTLLIEEDASTEVEIMNGKEKVSVYKDAKLGTKLVDITAVFKDYAEKIIDYSSNIANARSFLSIVNDPKEDGVELLPKDIFYDMHTTFLSSLTETCPQVSFHDLVVSEEEEVETKWDQTDGLTLSTTLNKDTKEVGEVSQILNRKDVDKFIQKVTNKDEEKDITAKLSEALLGEIIVGLSIQKDPLPTIPSPPEVPIFGRGIAVVGSSAVCRKRLADSLANQMNLQKIIVTELIESIIKSKSESELDFSVREALLNGKALSDELTIEVIINYLKTLSPENVTGWVIQDFPDSVEQAIKLEKALTGYDPNCKCPSRASRYSQLTKNSNIEEASFVPSVPKLGLNNLILLNYDIEESLSYEFGRRTLIENEEEKEVHLIENRPFDSCTSNHLLTTSFDEHNPRKEQFPLCAVTSKTFADSIIEYFTSNTSTSNVLIKLPFKLRTIEEQVAFVEQEIMKKESVSPEENIRESEENKTEDKETYDEEKEKKESEDEVSEDKKVENNETTEEETPPEETETPLVIEEGKEYEFFVNKIDNWCSSLKPKVAENLLLHWESMEEAFRSQAEKVFASQRYQRRRIAAYYREVRDTFKTFLSAHDGRHAMLLDFISTKFNNFDDDLRFEVEGKGELHLRTEELKNSLWSLCEEKEETCNKKLRSVATNGFLENSIRTLQLNYGVLLQTEVDRFHAVLLLIHDFCDGLEGEAGWKELETVDVEEDKSKKGKKGADPIPDVAPTNKTITPPSLVADVLESLSNLPTKAELEEKEESADPKKEKGKGKDTTPQETEEITGNITLEELNDYTKDEVLPNLLEALKEKILTFAAAWNINDPDSILLYGGKTKEDIQTKLKTIADLETLDKGQIATMILNSQYETLVSSVNSIISDAEKVKEEMISEYKRVFMDMVEAASTQFSLEQANIEATMTYLHETVESESKVLHEISLDTTNVTKDVSTRIVPLDVPRPQVSEKETNKIPFINENTISSSKLEEILARTQSGDQWTEAIQI